MFQLTGNTNSITIAGQVVSTANYLLSIDAYNNDYTTQRPKRKYNKRPFYTKHCTFILKTGQELLMELMFDKATNDELVKGHEYNFSESFIEMCDNEAQAYSKKQIKEFCKFSFELIKIVNKISFYDSTKAKLIKTKSKIFSETYLTFKQT